MNQGFVRLKQSFFDRAAVMRRVGTGTRQRLSQFGAFVRTGARRSIVKRKGPSKPGKPPHSHVGKLRRLIFFGYEAKRKNVAIGPLPLGAVGVVPPVLEEGGKKAAGVNRRRRQREVGGTGEIRIGGRRSRSSKYILDFRGKRQRVTFARLKTPAMASRANENNEALYGPMKTKAVEIEARPFMQPIFAQELNKLPANFAGAF